MKTFMEFLEQEVKAAGLAGLHLGERELIRAAVISWLENRISTEIKHTTPEAALEQLLHENGDKIPKLLTNGDQENEHRMEAEVRGC